MAAKVYRKPGFATKHVFNPVFEGLTRLGIGIRGARVLEVRGRKSGKWFSTPVNPLSFEGQRYLVAPRGETQWVRNIRASGGGRLRLGRRTEIVHVAEVPDGEKTPILRAYLRRWAMETGVFFGLPKNPTDEQIGKWRRTTRCSGWKR